MKEKILNTLMMLSVIFGVTAILLLARVAGPNEYEKAVVDAAIHNQKVLKIAASIYEDDVVNYLDGELFLYLQGVKLPTEKITEFSMEGDHVRLAAADANNTRRQLIRETGIQIPEFPSVSQRSYHAHKTLETIIALEYVKEEFSDYVGSSGADGLSVATLRVGYVLLQNHLAENGLLALESSSTQIGIFDLQARFQNELEAIRATYYR